MGTKQPGRHQTGGNKRRTDDEEDENFPEFSEHAIQKKKRSVKNVAVPWRLI